MSDSANAQSLTPAEEIAALIKRSRAAQQQIEHYTQEQVDDLIRDGLGGRQAWRRRRDCQFTVDETQLGNYDGKFLKIQRKTRATLMDIIDDKSVGIWKRILSATS